VGAVHLGLLERGAASAVDVDLSRPYIEAARDEAARRGVAERVRHVHGDFATAEVAERIEPADLVALDRVVCCHPDVVGLVGRAAERTRRRLAIVLPRRNLATRTWLLFENLVQRLRADPFRAYLHPHEQVLATARAAGLEPVESRSLGFVWRLLVFERR
jgi:magnesium-protoporphyrin O-methyltransferase